MRTGLFCLYPLLFTAYLYTQEADAIIQISHYQYPESEGIPIILDETGENTYFLNNQNPKYLIDTHINTLRLDGSIGIPLGSYFLPSMLPKSQATDSILNHSQIYYRKGDYDYNDLGIGLKIEISDSSSYSFQGYKRSPPQLYQTQSSELQNHLISYNRYTEKSMLKLDALYHLENYDLPMKEVDNNREVESFHGGLNVAFNLNYFSINIDPSFQFTYMKQGGREVKNFTIWNSLNSAFNFWHNFNISFNHTYKMRMKEYNAQVSEMPAQIFLSSIGYDSKYIAVIGGIASSNSIINPVGMFKFKLNNINLSVSRHFKVTFVPTEDNSLNTVPYLTDVINFGYSHKKFNGNVELFQYDASSDWGVRGYGNINLSWINLNQQAGIYNINKQINSQPIDTYSFTKIIFSPNMWPWKTGRFQPFVGMESVYIQHSGKLGIDPFNPGVFSNEIFDLFFSHLLNIEFGLLVNGFKVSYRWVNFNMSGSKINNSINLYPIPPIRHLEVVWQFLN